ncbi:MAG: hypothetical protein R3E39_10145 [Anaerolineae bacterium]
MLHRTLSLNRVAIIGFIMTLLLAAFLPARAQGRIELTQTAEYNIGVDCPVATALEPGGTTYWILMNNCGQRGYTLHAYNVADGSEVTTDTYATALMNLEDVFVDPFINPLGFTPSGDLSIRYNDSDTYESRNIIISLSTGEAEVHTSATYDALMSSISEYPEFSPYSPDHTRVVAVGTASLHVIDVQNEVELAEIPVEGDIFASFASFSEDNSQLHVVRLINQNDPNDHSAALLIYSLPDGALLKQYQVESSVVWVSPDGKRAAIQRYSNNIGDLSELLVMDLESGLTSAAANLLEKPSLVTVCTNTGKTTNSGFTFDGFFSVPGVNWLPDSSSLLVPMSYNGDAAEGGGVCSFSYSRIRQYSVNSGS